MSWRGFADWAKRRPAVLRIADRMGRGRGQVRLLDRLAPPPPAPRVRPDLAGWTNRELSAAWIGHATILLRIGGMTVLTDPVFSTRVGLDAGLMTVGPRRHVAPALKISELPPIDLILLSHAHFDHIDRPTLAKLPRQTPIIASENNGDLVRDLGFRDVRELKLNDTVTARALRVTAAPVMHWGPRVFFDNFRGYCGFLIESPKHRVLYGADSAFGPHFDRLRGIDLAILGIAAYDPYIAAHASPEQVWQMFTAMQAKWLLPMHHSTFKLSYEPMGEPIERMIRAAGDDAWRIVIRQIGESWTA